MTFTQQEIDELSHYAKKFYYDNRYMLNGDTLEDVRQNVFLFALQAGKSKGFGLGSKLYYYYLEYPENAEIKSAGSLFRENGEGEIYDVSDVILKRDNCSHYEFNDDDGDLSDVIKKLGAILYPDETRQNRFLDYVSGISIGAGRERDMRELFFRHSLTILSYLLIYGYIDSSLYRYYCSLLRGMKNYAPQRKKLKQTTSAINCRLYYERHKEKERRRNLDNYYKKKQIKEK